MKTLAKNILSASVLWRTVGLVVILFSVSAPVRADLTLEALGQTKVIDFQDFEAAGLKPGGGDGTLDSNTWSLYFSDESDSQETEFGGTYGAGDFGRGSSSGGVSTRGVYAFETGGGNIALGVQLGASGFASAWPALRVANNTGVVVDRLHVSYDAWVYNDSSNSNYLDLEFDNGSDYIDPVWFETPGDADGSPGWVKTELEYELFLPATGNSGETINALANGDTLWVAWSIGGDFADPNGYDEVAIDNIRITAVPEPSTLLLGTFLAAGLMLVSLKQRGSQKRR